MNAEILENAGINYTACVKRFLGRANLFEKMLLKFLGDTTFTRIHDAHESSDRAGLLAVSHEFKGMCGNIGLNSLYDMSDRLVRLLRAEDTMEDEIESAYLTLETEYYKIYSAVRTAAEE